MNAKIENPTMNRSSGVMRKVLLVLGPLLVIALFAAALFVTVKLNEKPAQKKKPYTTLAVMA